MFQSVLAARPLLRTISRANSALATSDVRNLRISTRLLEIRGAGWHSGEAASEDDVEAKTNVLVVDDNQDLAENIAEILMLHGFAATIAGSAEEALPKALPDGPNLLVTDYRLPGMTGAELVRRIRAKRASVRAVVISAYTDDGTVKAAREAGAEFLSKPVDLGALSNLLTAT